MSAPAGGATGRGTERQIEEPTESAPFTEREALRRSSRYVEEVVIGWGLCPWAERAWRDGQVARRVLGGKTADLSADLSDGLSADLSAELSHVIAFADELAAAPGIAVGLAIFPEVKAPVGAWERFAEQLRRARRPFLVAAFHPDYGADYGAAEGPSGNAAQLVALIRRTPDPTLQLVRASLLDGLGRGGRDVSADVAAANFATVTARGPAALAALLDDIRRDRD